MYLIGIAKDIHKIKRSNTFMVLGGYKFSSSYKVVAVSDGDLVLHALADAILGASQNGDIGMYFNDTCIRNKGLDSKKILNKALALAKKKGYKLVNADLTIICDKIMISPIRKRINDSLKKLLKTKLVNVKATRFEENKSLIACEAAIMLKKGK